jgi:hypothetical protein
MGVDAAPWANMICTKAHNEQRLDNFRLLRKGLEIFFPAPASNFSSLASPSFLFGLAELKTISFAETRCKQPHR